MAAAEPDETGTLLIHKGIRGVELLREIVAGARAGGFGDGIAEMPVSEVAAVLDRVRELESYAAQLLDQRDEALARRDQYGAEVMRARTALGDAWLTGRSLEDAIAVLRTQASTATAQAVGAAVSIDRSLDIQALEADVLEAAEAFVTALEEELGGAVRDILVLRPLLVAYREARARLDAGEEPGEEHDAERELIVASARLARDLAARSSTCSTCGARPLEVHDDGSAYCPVCEMRERRAVELADGEVP